MKSKLLIGLIVGLVFSIICNAGLTLSDIKSKIEYNSITNGRISEQLLGISQTKVMLPSASLSQLKKDLAFLSSPVDSLNQLRVEFESIKLYLQENKKLLILTSGDEWTFSVCVDGTNSMLEKITTLQKELEKLMVYENIKSLKSDKRYIELVKSDLDILGLSQNITITQGHFVCSINTVFNYLRSRSKIDLEKIKSKSSKEALIVLDNLQANSGNPNAMHKAVNGLDQTCMVGMFFVKFNLKYGSNGCIEKDNVSTVGIDVKDVASEFGLTLGYPIEYTKENSFILNDVEKIMMELPNGDYCVSGKSHYVFLNKTSEKISVYDSDSIIAEEAFGFAYHNEEAINHLLELSEGNWFCPISKLTFNQITVK